MQELLIGLLDQVLGHGEKASKTNRKYNCPFPDCPSHNTSKKKLEIDTVTDGDGNNHWHCWICDSKGKSLHTLFKKIKVNKTFLDQLGNLVVKNNGKIQEVKHFSGILPDGYIFMNDADPNDLSYRHAKAYLNKRNITSEDIIKYQIGYAKHGEFADRIIIPSYDGDGKINIVIGRAIHDDMFPKYKLPDVSRDIIPFEMFINWELPIILCEGPIDLISIKRNCIPLLGKTITKSLMKKLVSSKVKKIYIAIDNDALKMAITHCGELMSYGKKVFLVDLPDKDPNEMGFEKFTAWIQQSTELTPSKLMKLKLTI